jgi:hypothetical protein
MAAIFVLLGFVFVFVMVAGSQSRAYDTGQANTANKQ